MLNNFYNVLSENNGLLSVSITRTFDKPENESSYILDGKNVLCIDSINWCINSSGYVKLFWDLDTPVVFMILSGNGSWQFQGVSGFQKPDKSSGRILLTTEGFDDLDSFTIILRGKYKC